LPDSVKVAHCRHVGQLEYFIATHRLERSTTLS
jgi:hypothetical protein